MSFYNEHGLLNAHENEIVSENTLPFSVEHVILKTLLNEDSKKEQELIINYIEKLRNSQTNRFNNIPLVTEGNDKYISHDQITALCAFSAHYGLDYHKEFYDKIIFGTYDNITGEFNIKRFLHPRDLIFIGYLNDSKLAKFCMPLLCGIIIFSFIQKYKVRPTFFERLKKGFKVPRTYIVKTDGQLLSLIRHFGLRNKSKLFNITWDICLKLADMKFEGGFKGIFRTYFRNPEHPNVQLADKINNYKLDED